MKKNLAIGILGVIALFSLVFAYDRNVEADHQRGLAEFHKMEAQKQREIAEHSKMMAEEQRHKALENESLARLEALKAREEAERVKALLATAGSRHK